MIVSNLKNASRYFNNDKKVKKAFGFLEKNDLGNLQVGKYKIDGDDIFALVQSYDTKSKDKCKFESHKKYIDIQVILNGTEKMTWAPIDKLTLIRNDFSENDKAFYKEGSTSSDFVVSSNDFVVFYPEDGHRACIQVDSPCHVKKIVLKVSLE